MKTNTVNAVKKITASWPNEVAFFWGNIILQINPSRSIHPASKACDIMKRNNYTVKAQRAATELPYSSEMM